MTMDIRAQSVLACSDMHLSDSRPALTDAFLAWLDRHALRAAHPPQALLILGDAFDAWVGDDALATAADSSCAVRTSKALRAVADRGLRVLMMHGNRDFLMASDFALRCGAELLADHARLVIDDGPVVAITHGDLLCTRDTAYLEFRKMVRHPEWQKTFLAKPLDERIAIAQSLRDRSKTETAMKAEDIVDVTIDECEAMARMLNAEALLHGHTHRPGLSVMPSGVKRWVLPDWSMDDATEHIARGGGLRIDRQGATVVPAV